MVLQMNESSPAVNDMRARIRLRSGPTREFFVLRPRTVSPFCREAASFAASQRSSVGGTIPCGIEPHRVTDTVVQERTPSW